MKPTLFLLAAGMGSRYGGLKQLDGLGPNGETIMDYSIYDAIHAGFGKLVFVIRKRFRGRLPQENHFKVRRSYSLRTGVPVSRRTARRLHRSRRKNKTLGHEPRFDDGRERN